MIPPRSTSGLELLWNMADRCLAIRLSVAFEVETVRPIMVSEGAAVKIWDFARVRCAGI